MKRSTLRELSDYMDWDKLIAHCDEIQEFGDLEKARAKEAFKALQAEFGNGFLRKAYAEHHPIFGMLFNTAPWTRKWIAELFQEIQIAKGTDLFGSKKLINQLKDSQKFNPALFVLNIGISFINSGLSINFEPKIENFPKIPDLKIIDPDSNQEMYVEVSDLYVSQSWKESFRTQDRILLILTDLPFGFEFCGQVFRTLSPPHLENIELRLKGLIQAAYEDASFHELLVEDVIEVAVAPCDDSQLLQWASTLGLELKSFIGPPRDSAEINRTKSKIHDEQKQLPVDRSNILVIANDGLFLQNRDLNQIIREFEEVLFCYEQVLFLAVMGRWFGQQPIMATQIREHMVFLQENSMFTDLRILMLNKLSKYGISQSAKEKIIDAFQNSLSR